MGLKAWLRGGARYSAPGRAIRAFRRVFEPETQTAIAALIAIALLLLTLAIVRVEWWWIIGATLLGAVFALASTVRGPHPAPATGVAGAAQAGGRVDERHSRNPAVAAIGVAGAVGVVVGALALALGPSLGNWRWAVLTGEVVAVLVLALALRLWFPAARFLVAAAALIAAPLIGAGIAFALVVEWDYLLAIGLLTVGIVWLAFGALPGRAAGGVALTLFAGLALWSGAVGFLRLAGARDPQLESVDLTLRDGTRIDDGFYIGRKGDEIYVATNEPRRLRVLKESEVSTLGVGDLVDAEPEEEAADDGDDTTEGGPTTDDLPLGTPSTLEHRDTVVKTIDGVRLVLEVFEPRQSEALLVLDLRLTNDPGPDEPGTPFTIGGLLDDGEADARSGSADTLDGLEIVDRANEADYPVARTEDGRCVCSRSLRRITLAPGESTYLWAAFKRPAGDAELELHVPPPFRTLDLGEE